MLKKIFSVALSLIIFMSCMVVAYAGEEQAMLYSVYGDGMLFEQYEDVILAGTAPSGAKITACLYDSDNALVKSGESAADDKGEFSVSFVAPAGGFQKYTVVVSVDSQEFAKLENIVFGELWLASGQSNMMYPLGQEKDGNDMMACGEKSSEWLRVLMEPAYPEYNGSAEKIPVDAQNEIKDAHWITGESEEIYGMSAVAFFFAESMLEKINMPVGIINSSLGGTSIASWISRDAIDNCTEVKNLLIEKGRYIEEEKWNEDGQNIYTDMTANFNLRTNAYKNFRLSGMIWYQGESDLMMGYTPEEYSAQLELLQSSYTEHFGYKDGLFPIVYTQLAPYMYSDDSRALLDWNIEYSKFALEASASRAVVTNYDVPPTFLEEVGVIHPECKKEIGQRMAYAAEGLVYNVRDSRSAPYPISSEVADSSIYITFSNVGDGLSVDGKSLNGFAICGSNGVYLQAEAEVVNKDTVRVYSDVVEKPVSVTYAYCVGNHRSNLYSANGGVLVMPASPFVIGQVGEPHYWSDKPWADCEDAKIWRNYSDDYGANYKTWKAENAKIKISDTDAYSGARGLNIVSDSCEFSVSPVITYKKGASIEVFDGADADYSDYGSVSLYLKNNGTSDVVFTGVEIYTNAVICYNSAAFEQKVIPSDGQWHRVEVPLDELHMTDDITGEIYTNTVLESVKDIKLCFSSEESSDVSLDHIRFSAEEKSEEDTKPRAFGFLEKITAFINGIIAALLQILG